MLLAPAGFLQRGQAKPGGELPARTELVRVANRCRKRRCPYRADAGDLRGPLVGLTEEALLDIVWALPRSEEDPARLPRLDLSVNPDTIEHELARSVISKLQALARRTNSTTPHELLAQAIDVLRIRPILTQRHRGQAERALANVDLYLSLATAYAVRGLRAFSEAMTAAWEDKTKAVEGRPDAQEEAVSLFTMHAAKGLEWPIVIPINTMTGVMGPDSAVTDRETNTFYCPIFGIAPEGHEAAMDAEKLELDRERVRLWYVAATRARQLLVLPRLDVSASKSAWISILDLSLADLPSIASEALPANTSQPAIMGENRQTRETFAAEAAQIVRQQSHLTWLAPSRNEDGTEPAVAAEEADIWTDVGDEQPRDLGHEVAIQGSRERGLILHKLMEEVLTGEISDELSALTDRSAVLIDQLGKQAANHVASSLSPQELAGCVVKTLGLSEIQALRPNLLAEFPVYSATEAEGLETASYGIADALSLTPEGNPLVVIDWKSDVAPDAKTLDHYRCQVQAYLEITGAERGLIVLMTSGQIISVAREVTAGLG